MKQAANKSSDLKLYGRLLSYALPRWHLFAISVFGFLLFSLANVLLADLMQFIIDSVSEEPRLDGGLISRGINQFFDLSAADNSELRMIVPMAMLGAAALRGVGFLLGTYYLNHVARYVVHSLRCAVFNHLLIAPTAYYDQNTGGALISKITFTVEQVAAAASNALKILVREGFLVIGLLSYLLYINWQLSLVLLAITPVIAVIVGFVGKRFRRISRRIQDSMGDVTHVSNEIIGGHREVRMFGGKDYEQQRFLEASEYNRRQYLKMAFTDAISPPVLQLLISTALATLVWMALDPDLLAVMSAGQFVAFLTAAGLMQKPVRSLSEVYSTVQKGLAAADDLFALLDSDPERDSGSYEAKRVEGRVSFRNVGFAYSSAEGQGKQVLSDVSFDVEPGETVALVGLSGGGKTTLVSLLARFYDYSSGEILLDGVPIKDYRLENLRSHIALVSQNVTLFNDSVRNNIAYGALRGASDEAVASAAKIAHAKEFIEQLSEGMDTQVGDDGVLLSGGQRQRLALARAILKDAPLLILDEATSALDNEAERLIQDALEHVMQGRTTFVIAHRLSTIQQADRILVMEQGRVVEQGDHATLLEQQGRYYQLHQTQFRGGE